MTGNIILFRDFLFYSINSVSSEQSTFPSTNLLIPEKQRRYWKTNDTTDAFVIIDLGSAQQVTGIALLNVNYNTYKIQGDTTASFASPAVDSGTITTAIDPQRKRYYSFTEPQGYSPAFNYRYLRLFIPTQATTDGDTVFKTGGLVLKTGTTKVTINPDYGMGITMHEPNDKTEMRSGATEVRGINTRFATWQCSFTHDSRTEAQIDEVGNLLYSIDESESLIFCDNGNFLSKTAITPYVYILRRVGDASGSYSQYPIFTTSVTLKEQI